MAQNAVGGDPFASGQAEGPDKVFNVAINSGLQLLLSRLKSFKKQSEKPKGYDTDLNQDESEGLLETIKSSNAAFKSYGQTLTTLTDQFNGYKKG